MGGSTIRKQRLRFGCTLNKYGKARAAILGGLQGYRISSCLLRWISCHWDGDPRNVARALAYVRNYDDDYYARYGTPLWILQSRGQGPRLLVGFVARMRAKEGDIHRCA